MHDHKPLAADDMHILFVTNSLNVGGIETNLVRLTRALTSLGHQVTVLCGPGALTDAVERAGAAHVTARMDLRSARRVRQDVRTLEALLQKRRPDALHVFSATSATVVALARLSSRLRGRPFPPVVGTIMGLKVSPDEPVAVTYARAWATSFGVDVLLAVSPAVERVVGRLPIARRRVRRGRILGIDFDRASADPERGQRLRAALLGEGGTNLVLTVGRLDASKNHELFVASAAEVLRCHPGARFAIVGEGAERQKLAAQIDQLGLAGAVTLLGERSDVDDLLGCADVYVRPGVVEGGIGLTVLEAQAARVPVVSFDGQDVRKAIAHGVTGWLVVPGDVDGLADAISTLLRSSAANQEVVATARREVMERYDMKLVAGSLIDVYREAAVTRTTAFRHRLRRGVRWRRA